MSPSETSARLISRTRQSQLRMPLRSPSPHRAVTPRAADAAVDGVDVVGGEEEEEEEKDDEEVGVVAVGAAAAEAAPPEAAVNVEDLVDRRFPSFRNTKSPSRHTQ